MNNRILKLSTLGHTWILDLDGTIVKHNGYKIDGHDILLDGAKNFLDSIPDDDMVIFVTSRKDQQKEMTEEFLKKHEVRYDVIIYNAPFGERVLLNDKKPSGLETAMAINLTRNQPLNLTLEIDKER